MFRRDEFTDLHPGAARSQGEDAGLSSTSMTATALVDTVTPDRNIDASNAGLRLLQGNRHPVADDAVAVGIDDCRGGSSIAVLGGGLARRRRQVVGDIWFYRQ